MQTSRTRQAVDTLDFRLKFSQMVLNATASGSAQFASQAFNPGFEMQWDYSLVDSVSGVFLGEMQILKLESLSTVDPFAPPPSFLWAVGLGLRYTVARNFSTLIDVKIKRRNFIHRPSLTLIQGDPAAIPEINFSARFPLSENFFGNMGVGYLLSKDTTYSRAHSGVSFQGELGWMNNSKDLPLSFALQMEHTKQNTDVVSLSTWEIAAVLGVKFNDLY